MFDFGDGMIEGESSTTKVGNASTTVLLNLRAVKGGNAKKYANY